MAFIDLETTGLDPERHEIIEIGVIIVRQTFTADNQAVFEVIEELEYKVKPEHLETAEPEALRINGYNESEWLFSADLKAVMQIVADKTADCIMVGQNVHFDWKFLEAGFKKCGLSNKMHYHKLDTISIAWAKLHRAPDLEHFSLRELCLRFGIKNEQSHTALSDARATFLLYKKLLEL